MPEVHEQLMEILRTLEAHYQDMQDTEFTVEEGQLYMLQTRNAKRPAQAAVRFAVDAVDEGLLNRERALMTIDPDALDALLHPTFDPKANFEVLASGRQRLARRGQGRDRLHRRRRGGGRRGRARRDPGAAVHRRRGRRRLPRRQGDPHQRGRQGRHAALVARGMGRPAVVGAQALEIDLATKTVSASTAPSCTRATGSRSTGPRARSPSTTCRWWTRRWTRTSSRC